MKKVLPPVSPPDAACSAWALRILDSELPHLAARTSIQNQQSKILDAIAAISLQESRGRRPAVKRNILDLSAPHAILPPMGESRIRPASMFC